MDYSLIVIKIVLLRSFAFQKDSWWNKGMSALKEFKYDSYSI